MAVREIVKDVFAVGAVDWDRRLFDELIPLPDGTSYNSYLVVGRKKTALIDSVDPAKTADLLANLAVKGVQKIDYIIAHHAEQDHSGAIPDVLEVYPQARVVTNDKCKSLLIDLLHVAGDRFISIKDGDTLDLDGLTLEFILAPWVHWPETMLTYIREKRILFPCDFLGSHLAQGECFVADEPRTYAAAKRYYAEIMMPFRSHIIGHLKKIEKYAIDIIAPSHGPVYQKPEFILSAYRDWVSDRVANRVIIPFVSMHGSTRRMVEYLTDSLIDLNIPVVPINLSGVDIGKLAIELVDAATLVLASPMVLAGAHPAAVYAAYLANALRPKCRFMAIIGSYGWGGRMIENLQAMVTAIKPELLPGVFIKGLPREADFRALDQLAAAIHQKHQSIGIV